MWPQALQKPQFFQQEFAHRNLRDFAKLRTDAIFERFAWMVKLIEFAQTDLSLFGVKK